MIHEVYFTNISLPILMFFKDNNTIFMIFYKAYFKNGKFSSGFCLGLPFFHYTTVEVIRVLNCVLIWVLRSWFYFYIPFYSPVLILPYNSLDYNDERKESKSSVLHFDILLDKDTNRNLTTKLNDKRHVFYCQLSLLMSHYSFNTCV